MPLDNMLKSIATQLGSSVGREERVLVGSASFLEPNLNNLEGFPPQRCAALFTSLAFTADVGACSGRDIAAAQINEFRGA